MTVPLLSICIPTYNRANYLKRCLESLKIQVELKPELNDLIEIVISDNCSSDETRVVIESHIKFFKNYKFKVNDRNLGFDLNVVNVIRIASAKYCWYLGDDDLIVNGGIEYVTHHLGSEQYDVVTVEVGALAADGNNTHRCVFSDGLNIKLTDPNDFYFNGYCQGGFSVLIFDRELWLKCLDTNDILEHWLYYETVLKILMVTHKDFLYIDQSIILTGQDCRWAERGTELFTHINSNVLMEKMINFGFDKEQLNVNLVKNNKRILIMLLRAKGHDLSCSLENLQYLYSHTRRAGLLYLFVATIIYFIPNPIVKFIRDLRKVIAYK